jgi:hypothetical protein
VGSPRAKLAKDLLGVDKAVRRHIGTRCPKRFVEGGAFSVIKPIARVEGQEM